MVASTITVVRKYLDGRSKTILTGGVSILRDNSSILRGDNRTIKTKTRSSRLLHSWQVSWHRDSAEVAQYFEIFRNLMGFVFISPIDDERVLTGMPLKNTVTGLNKGDGSTTTFQMLHQLTLSYDFGTAGSISSTAYDVNYPLSGSVTAYKAGVSDTHTVDLATGIVTFTTAPGNNVATTYDAERGFPVIISSESLSRTLLQVDQTEARSVQMDEIP